MCCGQHFGRKQEARKLSLKWNNNKPILKAVQDIFKDREIHVSQWIAYDIDFNFLNRFMLCYSTLVSMNTGTHPSIHFVCSDIGVLHHQWWKWQCQNIKSIWCLAQSRKSTILTSLCSAPAFNRYNPLQKRYIFY